MATDKERFQSLTGMAEQLAEHSMERAQGAMKNYFGWLGARCQRHLGATRI
jgi:hypothetical protein